MPEDSRWPLILYFWEGSTFRDLAKAMGTNAGSAKRRVDKEIKRIRMELRREGLVAISPAALLTEIGQSVHPVENLAASSALASTASTATATTVTTTTGGLSLSTWLLSTCGTIIMLSIGWAAFAPTNEASSGSPPLLSQQQEAEPTNNAWPYFDPWVHQFLERQEFLLHENNMQYGEGAVHRGQAMNKFIKGWSSGLEVSFHGKKKWQIAIRRLENQRPQSLGLSVPAPEQACRIRLRCSDFPSSVSKEKRTSLRKQAILPLLVNLPHTQQLPFKLPFLAISSTQEKSTLGNNNPLIETYALSAQPTDAFDQYMTWQIDLLKVGSHPKGTIYEVMSSAGPDTYTRFWTIAQDDLININIFAFTPLAIIDRLEIIPAHHRENLPEK